MLLVELADPPPRKTEEHLGLGLDSLVLVVDVPQADRPVLRDDQACTDVEAVWPIEVEQLAVPFVDASVVSGLQEVVGLGLVAPRSSSRVDS